MGLHNASAADTWMLCPGSAMLNADAPWTSTVYTRQGNVAHKVAELCLQANTDAFAHLGRVHKEDGHDITVEIEMVDHVQGYLEKVRAMKEQVGAEFIRVENRLNLDGFHPKINGLIDVYLISATGEIFVIDLKYGTGIVTPAENRQFMMYALMLVRYLGAQREAPVHLCVYQPRGLVKGQAFRWWSTTAGGILDWANGTLKPAIDATLAPGAAIIPGDTQCKWCSAKHRNCPIKAQKALAVGNTTLEEIKPQLPPIAGLTDQQKGDILKAFKEAQFDAWIEGIKDSLKDTAKRSGGTAGGWKFVDGNQKKSWTSEEALVAQVGQYLDPVERKTMSPYKVDKALTKLGYKPKEREAILAGLILTQPGPQFFVPDTDERQSDLDKLPPIA